MAKAVYCRGFWRGTFVFLHRLLPRHLFLGVCRNFAGGAFWRESTPGLRLRILAWYLFCTDLRSMDRGGAVCPWRTFARRRLGSFIADRFCVGRGKRRGHLDDQPSFAAKYHARLLRRALPLGFARDVPHLAAGNQFSVEPARLSSRGKWRFVATYHDYRNIWLVLSGRRVQCTPRMERRGHAAFAETPSRDSAQCRGSGGCDHDGGVAIRACGLSESHRSRRAAQFS